MQYLFFAFLVESGQDLPEVAERWGKNTQNSVLRAQMSFWETEFPMQGPRFQNLFPYPKSLPSKHLWDHVGQEHAAAATAAPLTNAPHCSDSAEHSQLILPLQHIRALSHIQFMFSVCH